MFIFLKAFLTFLFTLFSKCDSLENNIFKAELCDGEIMQDSELNDRFMIIKTQKQLNTQSIKAYLHKKMTFKQILCLLLSHISQ